ACAPDAASPRPPLSHQAERRPASRSLGHLCLCAVCPFMASATPFREQCSQGASHSGLLEPCGTDLKEPGVRDMITCPVIPMEFNDFYATNAVVYAIQSARTANFVPLRLMTPIRKSNGRF